MSTRLRRAIRRFVVLLLLAAAAVVFYRARYDPGDVEIPFVAPQPDADADAREWRVLGLVVEETALDRLGGQPPAARLPAVRFTADEKRLIRRKHEEFEFWLAETTGGRLRAVTDILEVPGPVTSLSLARGDPRIHAVEELAYWAGPGDIAPLVQRSFPTGRYQMILAWVKLPAGVRVGGGAMTSSAMLRDQPFSSHFWLPNRRYTDDMMFAGISHEFYHQITYWLTRDLEYDPDIFPSNHPPNTISVGGAELLPAGETRRTWYTHVLSDIVTDTMWDAMLAWQRESAVWNDDNLAYGARPIGGATAGEVRDLGRLNDGSLGHDRLRDAAASHPASRTPVEAWFGLAFDEPTVLSRVTAYPRFHRSDSSYLARSLVVEHQTGGRWVEIRGTRRSENEAMKVDLAFPPITVTAIRLRILDERPDARGYYYRASCLELEAYR